MAPNNMMMMRKSSAILSGTQNLSDGNQNSLVLNEAASDIVMTEKSTTQLKKPGI